MCFGVPMRILRVHGYEATVEARGVERVVSTLLLEPESAKEGIWVLVHLGQAIEAVTEEAALLAWSALESLFGEEFPETLGTPLGADTSTAPDR